MVINSCIYEYAGGAGFSRGSADVVASGFSRLMRRRVDVQGAIELVLERATRYCERMALVESYVVTA